MAQLTDQRPLAEIGAIRDRERYRLDGFLLERHHEWMISDVVAHDGDHANQMTAIALTSGQQSYDTFQTSGVTRREHVKNGKLIQKSVLLRV
jgi:hypothetical protein